MALSAQSYVDWFTVYPSTHEKAGQTVEVVTREQYDRVDRALTQSNIEVERLRGVLGQAVEELGRWRDKGSALMRDELVDDFLKAARAELRRG